MKHHSLTAFLFFLLLAPAAHAGGEQCEPLARALTQGRFDAYVWNAKNYPDPVWEKYLPCEGQKVRLTATRIRPISPDKYLYTYDYAIDCGPSTFRGGYGYFLKPDGRGGYRCELSGE